MSRETENCLLLLVGLSMAIITMTGAFTRYVKPALLPYLAAAAVVIVALAVVAIVGDVQRGGPNPHASLSAQVGHQHDDHPHHSGFVWLLMVPVVVLAFVAPPALRPQPNTPTVTPVSVDVLKRAFPPLPPGPAPEVPISEVLVRATHDTAGTLDNRTITLVGFTLKTPDGVDLGRILINCCAADAQVARIRLEGPAAAVIAAFPEETWLTVEGRVVVEQRDTRRPRAIFQATSAAQTEPPKDTYSYRR